MTNKTITLNRNFKDLLLCVEGYNIKRKELIKIAIDKFGLTAKQAEGFVARNVYRLQQKQLLDASGDKGVRTYHLSNTLKQLVNPSDADHQLETEIIKGHEELSLEEAQTKVSLEMILSELDAYRDIYERFPRSRSVVQGLLNDAKKESVQLYGRQNALKKVIRAINQKSSLEY